MRPVTIRFESWYHCYHCALGTPCLTTNKFENGIKHPEKSRLPDFEIENRTHSIISGRPGNHGPAVRRSTPKRSYRQETRFRWVQLRKIKNQLSIAGFIFEKNDLANADKIEAALREILENDKWVAFSGSGLSISRSPIPRLRPLLFPGSLPLVINDQRWIQCALSAPYLVPFNFLLPCSVRGCLIKSISRLSLIIPAYQSETRASHVRNLLR